MNAKETHRQKRDIALYLKAGGKLDPQRAWRLFGCSKISTRCGELERDGLIPTLKRGWKTVQTKYGEVMVRTYQIVKL
jgi:hypothetical protein